MPAPSKQDWEDWRTASQAYAYDHFTFAERPSNGDFLIKWAHLCDAQRAPRLWFDVDYTTFHHTFCNSYGRFYNMARPSRTSVRYTDVSIPPEHVPEMIKLHANQVHTGELFQSFLQQGYRPTFGVDKERGRITAVAYAPETSINKGSALKANGIDWYSCIVSLCYKHFILRDGKAWDSETEEDTPLFG